MLSLTSLWRIPATAAAVGLLALLVPGTRALAQQTGSIAGRVVDERAGPVAGAQVTLGATGKGAVTSGTGSYLIDAVQAGLHEVRVRMIGYRAQTQSVTVAAGQRATQDFTLAADPLNLEAVVVTGTAEPRTRLETSNATTILGAADLDRAAPRSTTEMLRYVPGFTRVESSGGEVNQNITMRGILGVEYVLFMEDGLPVFPTMHTFFMNADNLFRPDENIERIEVVRGGSSALFGSNTPGAIINFINKTGGPEVTGQLKVSGATEGLARYDFNSNGPLGEDWRFNLGGFYRYDHGVRDPGYPGVRGGQLKASATRLFANGYLRASVKYIDDRNQFILPLPFQNPLNPEYVPGFSDKGAMTSNEGNHIRVPIPTGELELPLDDGLRTKAYWLTADASFEVGNGWNLQNTAQVMQNSQGWNAIVPFDVIPATTWVSGLGLTADSTKLLFTNHLDPTGTRKAVFNTANGLVAPGGEWHVEKPLSAFQNQLQLKKQIREHTISAGLYFANYTQENRWFFTEILTDVRDNPRFLDLIAFQGPNTLEVTKNGFRRFLSLYVNGSGQTTVTSGVLGGSFKLGPRLRADAGFRYEWDDYVQTVENTSDLDLDGDPTTAYDIEPWGNGTFRHFDLTIGDWAASVGLNYALNDQTSLYALGSRGYKMPALDEFLFAQAQGQVDVFGARRNWTGEVGVKHASRRFGVAVNGFYTVLKNIVGQGAVTDPLTGNITWIVQTNPENRAYGLEAEASATPTPELTLLGSATVLKADFSNCPAATSTSQPCPAGADVGSFLNGVPPLIGNMSATYTARGGFSLVADGHYVHRRFTNFATTGERPRLPTYTYLNLGASYAIPGQAITVSADLLNVYQSKGLEEGNPRLLAGPAGNLFLARPLLPRRFAASIGYRF